MTRLVQDWLGKNGELFEERAKESLAGHLESLKDSYVPMWKNGNYIPEDILELLKVSGHITEEQELAGNEYRASKQREFINNYKAREITEEEKFEMNANFSKGSKIVDVFTGKIVYITK